MKGSTCPSLITTTKVPLSKALTPPKLLQLEPLSGQKFSEKISGQACHRDSVPSSLVSKLCPDDVTHENIYYMPLLWEVVMLLMGNNAIITN